MNIIINKCYHFINNYKINHEYVFDSFAIYPKIINFQTDIMDYEKIEKQVFDFKTELINDKLFYDIEVNDFSFEKDILEERGDLKFISNRYGRYKQINLLERIQAYSQYFEKIIITERDNIIVFYIIKKENDKEKFLIIENIVKENAKNSSVFIKTIVLDNEKIETKPNERIVKIINGLSPEECSPLIRQVISNVIDENLKKLFDESLINLLDTIYVNQ